MGKTKIDYLGRSWNPIETVLKGKFGHGYHCTKVSEGCRGCWSERMNVRIGNGKPYDNQHFEFEIVEKKLQEPLKWKKPQMIGVQFMGDLFHEDIPFELVDEVFHTIAVCPHLTFQILTKRPERMLEYMTTSEYVKGIETVKNIWLGVSVEDQATADQRIPFLLKTPAAVRFVSIEPMLGAVDLSKWYHEDSCGCLDRYDIKDCPHCKNTGVVKEFDWVICGGESGPNARPMHPDWVRSLRDQCKSASVPFFFKQWGEWGIAEIPSLAKYNAKKQICFYSDGRVQWVPSYATTMEKVGKKKAGHLLDGKEHREMPEGK